MSAREQLDDEQLERLQERIRNVETGQKAMPFFGGTIVAATISATPTRVVHRLGRAPTGFIVVNASTPASVGRSATVAVDPQNAVNLEASATVDVSIWFW